jgi:cytochrome c-type biogenesis protein CcmH/NrfG
VQAYVLAVICLLVGIAGGWFVRGSQSPAAGVTETASASAPAVGSADTGTQAPTRAQMQRMADVQAGPLIEKLKADPNNAGLLANIGNIYYDTQQFPTAIDYYQRALQVEPANTLFNLGIVEWQGKMDIDHAVATWQKLLDTNPNYEGKDKVLQLMAQAKKHSGVKPAKPLQQ